MIPPRPEAISWDECFMRIAHVISERSKDPSTQVGALVATTDNVVMGVGYNGFPRGIENSDLPWDRDGDYLDTKYPYICHAEENAVYNASGSVKGCKIYCTLFPCNECAKAIIQNGISEVVYESDKYADTPAVQASKRLFAHSGVKTRQYISDFIQK